MSTTLPIAEETVEFASTVTPSITPTEIPLDMSKIPDFTFSWEELGYEDTKIVPLKTPSYVKEEPYYRMFYGIIFTNYEEITEYNERWLANYSLPYTGDFVAEMNDDSEVIDEFRDVNPDVAPWMNQMILFGNTKQKYRFDDGTLQWRLILIREDNPEEGDDLEEGEDLSYDVGDFCLFSPYGLVTIRETDNIFRIYEFDDIPENLLRDIYEPLIKGFTYIDKRGGEIFPSCNISLIEERKVIDG